MDCRPFFSLIISVMINILLIPTLLELAGERRRRKKNIFNSVRCIFILATTVMDRLPCAPNDNYASWILQQHDVEGIDELKHLLYQTSLELDRAQAHAKAQNQYQEGRLVQLQELLIDTCRERDEAREELLKLKLRLAECSMLTNTQHQVMSRDRPDWLAAAAETDEPNGNPASTTTTSATAAAVIPSNSSIPLLGFVDQLHWNTDGHDFDFAQLGHRANVDLHQPPASSSKVHRSNLIELQEHMQFCDNNDLELSFAERQETEQQQQQHQVESHLSPLLEDISTDYFWQQQQQQQQGAAAGGNIRQPSNLIRGISEPSASGHMTYQEPQKSGLVLASSPSINLCSTSAAAMPAHLPEPPEADVQVMLSTLPERGKLLQAVMQAGPLLQTLLLAGPLPQWRYPPPTLDTVEIPRISMCASSNSLPLGPIALQAVPAMDPPLQANHPSSPPYIICPQRRIINEPPNAAFITSLQSGSAAASSSSKLLCNTKDSAITASCSPLKFAKIH